MSSSKMVLKNREWVLSSYASQGIPTSDHLKLKTTELNVHTDSIPDGHVLVELLWLSIDPYLRSRMTGIKDGLYSEQFELNQVVAGYGAGRVIQSKDNNFQVGEIVINPFMPVSDYSIVPTTYLQKVDLSSGISLPEYLSALGVPGFAAWIAIEVIGNAKAGENVFISAAAGGVGMFAGQLAKIKGCRVIGSTGTDEKVKVLKEEFGYDDAFNYNKERDFDVALSKYFPNGIDIYVDNVGGKMLEAVLNHVNYKARIPVCGMISQYNTVWSEREGVRNLLNIVGKEVKMQGYMLISYLDRFGDFANEMQGFMKEKKLSCKLKIYDGIENFLDSLASLFSSSNIGKVVLQVKQEI
ncbi:hypothetical protein ACHQM5_004001 [Ranunculus cassubicifolius]